MSVKQISIFLENKKGRLAEVTHLLAAEKINIRALSLADTADFGVLRIIVNDPDACLAVLKANSIVAQVTEVIAVEIEDKPGGLARALAVLDAAGLNVEYMYAYVEKKKDNAIVICKIDDRERALDVLSDEGVATLNAQALKAL
ncbi:MAG TPA: ACT domain-containing protein [Spirochaetia bacterium]|nr:ACT domain-containing protein [Spirochaetia bacterium]